jgi:hypothetical protein
VIRPPVAPLNPYSGPPDEIFGRIPKQLQALETKIIYIGVPDADGNRPIWDLWGNHAGEQGLELGPNIGGLMHVPFQQLMSEGPYQIGATHERTNYLKREIDWQILVSNSVAPDTSWRYRMLEERWWSSWSSREDGYCGVFTRTHGWRFTKVRLAEEPKTPFVLDPVAFGNNFMAWDMTIVAADPYWCKRLEVGTWRNTDDEGTAPSTPWDELLELIEAIIAGKLGPDITNLIPGMHIGEGNIVVPNRAPEPAWPKFLVTGPGRAWIEDGPGGDMVELPLLTDKDGYMMVDTDPDARTLTGSTDPVDPLFYRIARNSDLLDFLLHDILVSTLPVWRRMEGRFTTPWPGRSVCHIKVQHSQDDGQITAFMPQRYARAYG